MDLRAGVKVYVGVLQKLPIRLNDQEEIKTLRLIQLVIFTAIGMTHKGHSGVGFPSYGMAMVRNYDAELKKVLEEFFTLRSTMATKRCSRMRFGRQPWRKLGLCLRRYSWRHTARSWRGFSSRRIDICHLWHIRSTMDLQHC